MKQLSKGKAIGLSIASLALGVGAFAPYGIGLGCGIASLILAKNAKKECALVGFSTGMATSGTITSIIGMVLSTLFTALLIALIVITSTLTYNHHGFW